MKRWLVDELARQRRAEIEYKKYKTCKGCRETVTKLIPEYRDSSGGYCSIACYNYVNSLNKYAKERYAPNELRQFILKRDKYKCQYCRVLLTNNTANIEHVKPWPVGTTVPTNLVASCRSCNRAKYINKGYSLIVNNGKYSIQRPDYILPAWARRS